MRAVVLLSFIMIIIMMSYGDADLQTGLRDYYSKSSSTKSVRPIPKTYGEDILNSHKGSSSISRKKNVGSTNSTLGAWGIIAIVIVAILVVTSGYYAFVFYPFLCKRERNYDMIELTNV